MEFTNPEYFYTAFGQEVHLIRHGFPKVCFKESCNLSIQYGPSGEECAYLNLSPLDQPTELTAGALWVKVGSDPEMAVSVCRAVRSQD